MSHAKAWIKETGGRARVLLQTNKGVSSDVFTSLRVFYRRLPNCIWHKESKLWSAQPSPIACYWLKKRSGIDCSPDVMNRAAIWEAARESPRDCSDAITAGKTDPWPHQRVGFWFAEKLHAALLAMDMGTGKSLVASFLAEYWGAKRILVVCPCSVLNVWPREFKAHSKLPCEFLVLNKGTSTDKAKHLQKALLRNPSHLVVVINYESSYRGSLGELILGTPWDVVIADEAHKIKSPGGKASRFMARLGERENKRLALTGTPLPHSRLDAYGVFRFLDPAIFGTSFTNFRSRYAKTHPVFPSQVVEWLNEDEFTSRMNLLTYRVEASDVLDLPPVMHERISVQLEPKARKIYKDLAKHFIAELECGEITPANGLVRLLRFQQITGGWAVLDDETQKRVDHGKQAALLDLLEGLQEKVVIFYRFDHDKLAVRECCAKLGRRYGEISGERKDLSPDATYPQDIEVMAVQIASGSTGIDLTAARIAVYYSLDFNLANYDQSIARLHRPGQTKTTWVYHLVAAESVDEHIYTALQLRRDDIQFVFDCMKELNKAA